MDPVVQFINYYSHPDRSSLSLSRGHALTTSVVSPVARPVKLELSCKSGTLSFSLTELVPGTAPRIVFDNNDQYYGRGNGVAAFIRFVLSLPEMLRHQADLIVQSTLDAYESEPRSNSRVQVTAFIENGQFGIRQYLPAPCEPASVILGAVSAHNVQALSVSIQQLCADFCRAYLHANGLFKETVKAANSSAEAKAVVTAGTVFPAYVLLLILAGILLVIGIGLISPGLVIPSGLTPFLGYGLMFIATAFLITLHWIKRRLGRQAIGLHADDVE